MSKPTNADKVRKVLSTRKGITPADVTEAAGVPAHLVTAALRKLAEGGFVVAKATKAGTTWRLTAKGSAANASDALAAAPEVATNAQEARQIGRARAARTPKAAKATQPAESVAAAPAKAAAPKAPAPARTAGVDETVAFLEGVRPVSAQPAVATPAKRTRRAAGTAPTVYATFARGELRDAVLSHLQATDGALTVHQVATALNAQAAPVATNLQRMANKGLVDMTSDKPATYRAA